MATIHFRIDKETKHLAMKAAQRHKKTLTELMRQRVEELAEEEREYQNSTDEEWLEQQINRAFSCYDAEKGDFISNDKMTQQMDTLETLAAQGSLYTRLCNCLILICSIQHQKKVNLWTKNSYRLWLTNWPKISKPLTISTSSIAY